MTAFYPRRAAALLILMGFVFLGAEVYQTIKVGQNAGDLQDVIRSTKRIETVVQPVCITPGEQRTCRRLLVAADESRIVELCRLTASVLRQAGIEARCDAPDLDARGQPIETTTEEGDDPSAAPIVAPPTVTTGEPTTGSGGGSSTGEATSGPPGPRGPQGPPEGPPGNGGGGGLLDPVCNATRELLGLC